jgi:hypothetical protein
VSEAELAGDLDSTVAADPHLNHVPTMAEGAGREDDAGMLFGKLFPPDVIMPNQHTVGQDHRRNGDQLHDTAPID